MNTGGLCPQLSCPCPPLQPFKKDWWRIIALEAAPAEPAGPSKQNSQNNRVKVSPCLSEDKGTWHYQSIFYVLPKQYVLPLRFKIMWRQKEGKGTRSQSFNPGIQLAGSYKLHEEPNASEFIFKIAMMKFDRLSLSSSSYHCSLIRADLAQPMGAWTGAAVEEWAAPLLPLQELSDGTKVLIQLWEAWIKPTVFLTALPCNPGVWDLCFVLVKPLQTLSQFLCNVGNHFLSTITIALGSHQPTCAGQGF